MSSILDQDALEEFLADRLLKHGETPGQAVLSAIEIHEEQAPLAVCFALVTVAADLRLYGSSELNEISDACFETAALLACDIHAALPRKDNNTLRRKLLIAWGDGDSIFNRAGRTS